MNIRLKRPLAIFDIEATGLSITQDRIVEIAILKISPDGSQENYLQRVNPGMKIPEESIAIHGITNADIADKPALKDILPQLEAFVLGCDLAGYNSNKFDLPMLAEELLRAESKLDLSIVKHIDVQNIFHKMEQRTLVAAYKFYCDKNLENAHSALADAEATWEVLDAQIARYEELTGDVDFLSNFSQYGDISRVDFSGRLALNESNQVIYNFGKHKNKSVEEVMKIEPGYYGWMMDADFPLYTKLCLKKEMNRIKANKIESKPEEKAESPADIQEKLNALRNKFKQ